MRRGGGVPIIAAGLGLAGIVGIVAMATHGFQPTTDCSSGTLLPTLTVKVSGAAASVDSLSMCVADLPCVTAPRQGEATSVADPGSAGTTGATGAANGKFVPSFSASGSDRPRTWIFDVGQGDPPLAELTAKDASGHVLARTRVSVHWHAYEPGNECSTGDVADAVTVHVAA